MGPRKEKGSNRTLEQVLRREMGNGGMADQALMELSKLGQEWEKTQTFMRRTPERKKGFTARPF